MLVSHVASHVHVCVVSHVCVRACVRARVCEWQMPGNLLTRVYELCRAMYIHVRTCTSYGRRIVGYSRHTTVHIPGVNFNWKRESFEKNVRQFL